MGMPPVCASGIEVVEHLRTTAMPLAMCHWRCRWAMPLALPWAMCHWRCAIGDVPSAMCHWRCAVGDVPLAMYHWRCAIGGVPLAVCRWRCAIGGVPLALRSSVAVAVGVIDTLRAMYQGVQPCYRLGRDCLRHGFTVFLLTAHTGRHVPAPARPRCASRTAPRSTSGMTHHKAIRYGSCCTAPITCYNAHFLQKLRNTFSAGAISPLFAVLASCPVSPVTGQAWSFAGVQRLVHACGASKRSCC